MIIQEISYTRKHTKKYKNMEDYTNAYVRHIGYGARGSFNDKTLIGTIISHRSKCRKLEKLNYKNLNFGNGGDDDILVINHDEKVFAFVEYGTRLTIGQNLSESS